MDILIAWGLLGALAQLFKQFGGLILLVAVVAGAVAYMTLRDRLSRLERRLVRLEAGVPSASVPVARPEVPAGAPPPPCPFPANLLPRPNPQRIRTGALN